ncbi:MAG: glycosyltransferase family 9 protein [bacterium]
MRNLNRLYERLNRDAGKALVVQTAFLGDVVLLTPLLKAIRSRFPKLQLWCLVRESLAEIVRGWVDEIITIDKDKATSDDWEALIQTISRIGFTVSWSPHRSFRSGYLLYKANIPVRIGFNRGGGSLFMTHKVNYPVGVYEGLRNLALLGEIPFSGDRIIPQLPISQEIIEKVNHWKQKWGLNNTPYFVIAPGSVWETKKWGADKYRDLSRIAYHLRGWVTVVVGSSSERGLGEKIGSDGTEIRTVNSCGELSPLEVGALMERAEVVVSGDTAAAHLATAVGVPQVIIYGSTAPRWGFFPFVPKAVAVGKNLWCRPCTDHGRHRCPLHQKPYCLENITPQEVWEIIESLIP